MFTVRAIVSAELLYRERNRSEECARVFVVRTAYAFFFGNAVIGCLHEDLRRSYDSDNREDTKGNEDLRAGRIVYERSVKVSTDGIGNFGNGCGTALARTSAFAVNARAENQGLYGFYNRNRCIATAGIDVCYVASTVLRRRREGGDSSLPAIQNNVFFKNTDSTEGLRASTDASFELKLNVVANGDTIKAAIKRHFVYADKSPEKPYAPRADIGRVLKDFFAACGEIYPRVFEAVAISATIQNPLRINANGSLPATGECTIIVSVFQHHNFSLS